MLMIDHENIQDHRATIVIAEDDTGVRRSLQLLLLGQALEVRSYASSTDVLADPSSLGATCLVTDYRMPELDGIDLLLGLRQLGWTGRSILITAYLTPELEAQALAAGFDIVLNKPFQRQDLVDAVWRLVKAN